MSTIIIIGIFVWIISAICKSVKAKQIERNRQAQIARINAENMKRKAEAQRMREEFRQRQLEAKLEIERMVAIEREQIRLAKEAEKERKERIAAEEKLAKEAEKQAARIAKIEEEQRKMKDTLYKAVKDIDHLTYEMEQKRKYGEYLELERDACVKYGAEWHKWNNRVSTNNNQLYAMETKLDNAINRRNNAQRKLTEVA